VLQASVIQMRRTARGATLDEIEHAKVGVEYPVAPLSHCGVGWAYFAGRFWVIDPPQPEGATRSLESSNVRLSCERP
jgi:hypothetical protein